jgi:hypothetical protein
MTHLRAAVISGSVALMFAASVAVAQSPFINPHPLADREVDAAMQSLQDAMTHLAKSRTPNGVAVIRARAYIALAATELQSEPTGLQ